MKMRDAEFALLTPAAEGWHLRCGAGAPVQNLPALADASAALPPGWPVHLALPCHALVIEGLKLPATARDELAGMVRLQLEKNLPYPPDEVSSDFVIVESSASESTVVAVTAPHAALESLCAPLKASAHLPEKITPFVLHVAASCPANETILAVYPEQGHLVLAIVADGNLSWAHVIASTDAGRLAAELPQLLLAATMEGAATTFSRLLLAPECWALTPVLNEAFTLPIDPLPKAAPALATPMNLLPAPWRADAQRQRKMRRVRRQLKIGAAVYTLAAVLVLGYVGYLRHAAGQLEKQLVAARPKLERIQAQRARSEALASGIDPHRFTVELLYLLQRALPDDTVRITEFGQELGQWHITGEAPSAGLAIDYVARIKADKELAAYEITAGPPQLLPNEHAQFGIFGKR
jgi:hypothetical protein